MKDRGDANYHAVKGVIDRNHSGRSEDFSDQELRTFFHADEETILKLRKEEPGAEAFEDAKQVFGECYEKIQDVLKYYLDLSEDNYHLISVWILGSYLQSSFEAYPYLFLNAMRGSAKTRTLRLISHLAWKGNGNVETGINETTLYRTEKGATLVIDEVEGIGSKEKAEFRQYLNASYKKGITVSRSRKVKRKDGEDYVVEKYEPYRPIAMANIWGMEEVLGDRCITLILEKSADEQFIKIIEDFESNYTIQEINLALRRAKCSLCSVVTKKNMTKMWNNYIKSKKSTLHTQTPLTTLTTLTTQEIFQKIDASGIDGRNLELFLPLFLTSLLLNEDIFLTTLEIGKKMVAERKADEVTESKDVSLYSFISTLNNARFTHYNIAGLTREFKVFLGDQDDLDDRWLNSKWMGRALKRLNLVTSRRRMAQGMEVTLNVDKALEKMKDFKGETKEDAPNNDL